MVQCCSDGLIAAAPDKLIHEASSVDYVFSTPEKLNVAVLQLESQERVPALFSVFSAGPGAQGARGA